VTLKRYPAGVHGDFFYEKDAPGVHAGMGGDHTGPRREGGPDIRYIMINDIATLGWWRTSAASSCIRFLHRAPEIRAADMDRLRSRSGRRREDILTCAETAFLLRDLLEQLQLKSWVKVSGSKGLQVYVPLNTPITYASTQPSRAPSRRCSSSSIRS
jgi:bifunctional non-homologous end joining protein LigD